MNLSKKIFLFAIVPLLLVLCAISATVYYQASSLAKKQLSAIQPVYLASKKTELENYVLLAKQAIAHLYDSGRTDDAVKEEAKKILRKLAYGNDGYLFVNDFEGIILVQPPQPWREGTDDWYLKDENGNYVIQNLISRAQSGGGLEKYVSTKPSSGERVSKLAYVVALPNWEWVLGTGIYLDDVDHAIAQIGDQVSNSIYHTMFWIVVITFLGIIIIFIGLMRNINERTKIDEKLSSANEELNKLTQRVINVQDEERRKIAYDLHDGVKSTLVAIKMQVEIGIGKLPNNEETNLAQNLFQSTVRQLKGALDELKRVMYGIYPIDRESLSLVEALNQIAINTTHAGMPTEFSAVNETDELLASSSEGVLIIIAQEAVANIVTHAKEEGASQAWVRLKENSSCIKLTIRDNGHGFNIASINRGIGLHSMKARLEAVGGKFYLRSTPRGTIVSARIPRH